MIKRNRMAALALAGMLSASCATREVNMDKALRQQKDGFAKAEKKMKKDQEKARKRSESEGSGSSW